ncbi:MAG TPA: SPOR domain-containing protein [bacterium]|nr:SPOR domain-containing protein [bacterium]
MSDTYVITRRNLYILVASAAVLSILLVIFGFVLGRNVSIPEPFPSVDQLTGEVASGLSEDELPEEIRSLRKSSGEDTSGQPFVDNEKLSFYDTLKIDDEPDADDTVEKPDSEPRTMPEVSIRTDDKTIVTSAIPTVPPTATPNALATAGPDFSTAYVVQVHSVKNKAWAEKACDDLERRGYPSYISRVRFKTGVVNYRVRIGPYLEKEAAEMVKERIRKELHQSPLVMTVRDGQK